MGLSIINKGAIPHDIIYKLPVPVLELGIIVEVDGNEIFLLFFMQVILQLLDDLYDVLTVICFGDVLE